MSFKDFTVSSVFTLFIAMLIMTYHIDVNRQHVKQLERRIESPQDTVDSITCTKSLTTSEATDIDELMSAIIYVESRGKADAYNETSGATGCMQLTTVMVDEVNRICRLRGIQKTYTLDDRWSCKTSKQMFRIWYNFHHQRSTAEKIARHWWGGPKWGEDDISIAYWEKVKERLDV